MGILEILVLLVVVAGLVAGGWALARMQQRKRLSGRFGPEYDRAVRDTGDAKLAERELARREERVEHLDIRALPLEERNRYTAEWKQVQARFVDQPEQAVADADRVIADVMLKRGYPMGDFDSRAADLSVDHPQVVQHYRAGHELAERSRDGSASTEDLRQAMVHYRALFNVLLEDDPTTTRRRAG